MNTELPSEMVIDQIALTRWVCDKRGHVDDVIGLQFSSGLSGLIERRYCRRCLIDLLDQHLGQVTPEAS